MLEIFFALIFSSNFFFKVLKKFLRSAWNKTRFPQHGFKSIYPAIIPLWMIIHNQHKGIINEWRGECDRLVERDKEITFFYPPQAGSFFCLIKSFHGKSIQIKPSILKLFLPVFEEQKKSSFSFKTFFISIGTAVLCCCVL